MEKKLRIYFTHDTEDIELANTLVDILDSIRIFNVFLSPFDLPGQVPKFDDAKKTEIERCDLMVALFTRKSLRWTLVNKEIDFAKSKNKIVVPLVTQRARVKGIGKVLGQLVHMVFARTKLETAVSRVLTTIDLLQTRLSVSSDSIAEARMALKEYSKQQFTFRMSKTARTATFRRIVAETMKKLGYSIREQPLFFLVRGYIHKEFNLVATREGHSVNIRCFFRRVNDRDVTRTARYMEKGVSESWIVAVNFTPKTQDIASIKHVNLIPMERLLGELTSSAREPLLQRYVQLMNAQAVSIVNRKFYPELRDSLRMVRSAKTSAEKGRSFERLAECFVKLFSGLGIAGRNVRIEAEELDLVVKNEVETVFWQRLGAPIIVECKNWTKPVGAREVRDLVQKMREVRTAFLIAAHGVTSRDGASYEIIEARKNMKFILVFDIWDIEEILRGTNPEEIVKERFYSLWTKA